MNKIKSQKIERCEKCGGCRAWTTFENGMKTKGILSISGVKCRHKWRKANQKESLMWRKFIVWK